MRGPILIVDDDRDMCEVLAVSLQSRHFDVDYSISANAALAKLASRPYAAIVTDLFMQGTNGIELCSRITASDSNLPVIVITAFGTLDTAVAAIRAGAYDFVTKPLDTDELVLILERAIAFRNLRIEVQHLRTVIDRTEGFSGIIGESQPMRRLITLMAKITESDASVLLTGETGTGKELVARSLHESSRRSSNPFVAIDCAAVPEALLESELFGHCKGAFTDARSDRKGLFQLANGGTIFLDEIGNMPLSVQPKLLRALQDRRVRPLGSDTEIAFDVRVISATNRDIEFAVSDGTFREDLFFRINVIHIELPPLRARGTDILLLARQFIVDIASATKKNVPSMSAPAAQKLMSYPWPGNVRELHNCIERAMAFSNSSEITLEELPDKVCNYSPSHVIVASEDPSELVTMEEVERRYIQRVLKSVGGNKTLAARILGFDRKTLYRKLEGHSRNDESNVDVSDLGQDEV